LNLLLHRRAAGQRRRGLRRARTRTLVAGSGLMSPVRRDGCPRAKGRSTYVVASRGRRAGAPQRPVHAAADRML
jgi:hypothetical protein